MGCVKPATEPSRIESLTANFRTRVLPASTLNGKLTPRGSNSEVLAVLVDPGAEAGGAHRQRRSGSPRLEHLAVNDKCLARNNKSVDPRAATNASNGETSHE
jgi:hypothetical protein